MSDSNFLRDYMLFTSGNEANVNYHMWSALTALSSIVSRRVWINQGYFRVYPNLYTVLLGPPGNKKTTAMNIAKGLVREIGDIPFSAECQTKESLVKELATYQKAKAVEEGKPALIYTPISIFVTELSQFLGISSGHMIDFLTTVYDAEFYDLKTKNKGSEAIIGPYVTILACTTTEWITSYLKTDIITGGFSRRALFVLEYEDGKRIPFPVITEEQREAWSRVIQHSKSLLDVAGEFLWTTESRLFYEEWYTSHEIPKDPTTRGYFKTKHIQLLKIAMLLALAKSLDKVMHVETLEAGLALLEKTEVNLPKVFQGMGRNELSAVASKVIDILEMTGGPLPLKKLQALMYSEANGAEFYSVLNHLVETEKLTKLRSSEKDGQPAKEYVALLKHVKL